MFAFRNLTAQAFKEYDKISSHLTISGGINSNTGLVGMQFEQKISEPFSIYAGAGLGTWGYKLSAGTRYYLGGAIGSAFGFGIAHATGVEGVSGKFDVIENNQTVSKDITYDLKPISLLHVSWLRYWTMGKRNRFNIELGYSLPLFSSPESNYSVPSNVTLDKTSKDVLAFVQPGGITISLGFNFGLAQRFVPLN